MKLKKKYSRDSKLKFFFSILSLFLLFESHAYAQYFGRNKVQYEKFNWKVLQTKNFSIHYYPKETESVYDAAYMLERWNGRFSQIFGKDIGPAQPIILYANHADFQQTNVISGFISQSTGGVTEGLKNRIILPSTGVYQENNHVLGHELVHAFQYDLIRASAGGLSAAGQLPLWFVEGLAEYLSIGRKSTLTAMWMRDAVLNDDIPTIDEISYDYKYFPYRYGHAIWNFITEKWGDEIVAPIFKAAVDSGFSESFEVVLGIEEDSLSSLWQNAIRQTYQQQVQDRIKPSEVGEKIRGEEGGLNLSPVISPDGKYIALITRADLFTLDLYLADAYTGELIEELASSNTDSHFDALRFMNSSGSWSPDSRMFAFVIIEEGDNQIAILDVSSKDILKKINVNNVDAITNLAWSPDGRYIALCGSSGGINDLYLYDLENNQTIQLTDDKYSELHPAWSPDGEIIAFATDRGEMTDLSKYNFGSMNIGLMNIDSKKIELIKIAEGITHINPQFSGSGNDIYFIADPEGFSDLFHYDLNTKEFFRVTKAATGISGLTELSHAMSLSQNTGRIVFNVFDNTNYNIHAIDIFEAEEELFEFNRGEYLSNISLPPIEESNEGIVTAYLNSPIENLPAELEPETYDYSPSLGLIYVGQAFLGVAADRFGTGIGGGVSMLFSDMLGNHLLAANLQVNGSFEDIGGQAAYMNLDGRWNWGIAISHTPYLTGFVNSGIDTVNINGEASLAQEFIFLRQRVFVDRLSLITEYPLSFNRRLEFSGGYTRISYSLEEERLLASFSGFIYSQEERSLDAPPGLNLFQASAAYVGDYSFFGFTSPVNGSRYRFEIEPAFGTLQYASLLADYRQYIFWNPFTLAIRGLHYGRYFGDSDSDRLTPLQIGFDTWVRGYNLNSFDISECSDAGDPNGCPEIDRLIGSRVGIFNMEFRIPVFGTEQFGLINFGFLPTEVSLFLDGGVAWTQDEDPVFEIAEKSTERIPVFSAGAAARVNVLGYMVVQFYYAFPFQRPNKKDGIFGFVISPGW